MSFEQWSVVVGARSRSPTGTARSDGRLWCFRSREQFGARTGHSVLAMVTSAAHARWPLDVVIADRADGRPTRSLAGIRMKLFTLDDRLIQRQVGILGDERSRG